MINREQLVKLSNNTASDNCGFARLACVKVEIDYEEGEGL